VSSRGLLVLVALFIFWEVLKAALSFTETAGCYTVLFCSVKFRAVNMSCPLMCPEDFIFTAEASSNVNILVKVHTCLVSYLLSRENMLLYEHFIGLKNIVPFFMQKPEAA
jgi:hypothetical protein